MWVGFAGRALLPKRIVLPRWRMDFRRYHCARLSGPVFEGRLPAKVNQASDNQYFNEQSHSPQTDRKSRPRSIGKRARLLCDMPFHQDHICPGCAVAHLARFAIFLGVEPFPGALR